MATRSGSLRNGYVTEPGSVFAIRRKPNAETWRAAAETGVIHKAAKRGDEVGEQISKICLPESKGLGYLRNKEQRSRVVRGVGSVRKGNWKTVR